MLAQRPACALARFSFVMSTRAKAPLNIKRSGPFLRRYMDPFYSAIDTLTPSSTGWCTTHTASNSTDNRSERKTLKQVTKQAEPDTEYRS